MSRRCNHEIPNLCQGVTKLGSQCARSAKDGEMFCPIHLKHHKTVSKETCAAILPTTGHRCKRSHIKGSSFCSSHFQQVKKYPRLEPCFREANKGSMKKIKNIACALGSKQLRASRACAKNNKKSKKTAAAACYGCAKDSSSDDAASASYGCGCSQPDASACYGCGSCNSYDC